MEKILLFHFILVLVVRQCASSSVVVRYEIERRPYVNGTAFGSNVTCKCDYDWQTHQINGSLGRRILKGDIHLSTCKKIYPSNVCRMLFRCEGCIVQIEECFENASPYCTKEIYELNEKHFKKEVEDGSRKKRDIGSCQYPTKLLHSDLGCRTSGKKVTCFQKCIFGYTLPQGRNLEMTCHKDENVWKPKKYFEDCEPYIDCTLTLTSGGFSECLTPTSSNAPLCYVGCHAYEDKSEVPRRAYECMESGQWSRKLPFCVTGGSGLQLVPRPRDNNNNQVYKSGNKSKRGH